MTGVGRVCGTDIGKASMPITIRTPSRSTSSVTAAA